MEPLALLSLALLAWAVARSVRTRRIQKQQDERLQRIDALAMTLSEVMPRTGPRSETAPPPTSPAGESPQSRPSPESPQAQRPKAEPRQAEHPSVPVTPAEHFGLAARAHACGTPTWSRARTGAAAHLSLAGLARRHHHRSRQRVPGQVLDRARLAELTGLYRAASFLGLGLCLVGIGYLYQRLVLPAPGPGEAGQKS
jgi:uncharacterized membrane protein